MGKRCGAGDLLAYVKRQIGILFDDEENDARLRDAIGAAMSAHGITEAESALGFVRTLICLTLVDLENQNAGEITLSRATDRYAEELNRYRRGRAQNGG
jgi:hypothetical protein